MTTSTQSNVIRKNPSILSIKVGPLNKSWAVVLLSTVKALCRLTKVSSNPIVKSSVSHSFTLPRIMLFSLNFFESLKSNRRKFFGFFSVYAKRFSLFKQFFISGFRITFPRTIISWFYFRWRSPQVYSTG